MNNSHFGISKNNYITPDNKIFIYEPAENLSTIGIFISSIILSIGGFISLVCKLKKEKIIKEKEKDNISNKV